MLGRALDLLFSWCQLLVNICGNRQTLADLSRSTEVVGMIMARYEG